MKLETKEEEQLLIAICDMALKAEGMKAKMAIDRLLSTYKGVPSESDKKPKSLKTSKS